MNKYLLNEGISPSGQKALEAAKSSLQAHLAKMSAPEPVLAVLAALNRINPESGTVQTREEIFRYMKERLKIPPDVINHMRNIIGYEYVKQSTAEKNKTLTAYRELVKLVEEIWNDKKKNRKTNPSSIKEAKFTKSFIKQIIMEELSKLEESDALDQKEKDILKRDIQNKYGLSPDKVDAAIDIDTAATRLSTDPTKPSPDDVANIMISQGLNKDTKVIDALNTKPSGNETKDNIIRLLKLKRKV